MPSVFTRILQRELPGRFVYEDDACAAFLTIAPVTPGHTLVVTRREVDDWLELTPDERNALWAACATVGKAIDQVFHPGKVAAMLVGLEVPHVHVHLIPINSESQLSFANADPNPDPAAMDEVAAAISAAISRD
ncbi:MAG TPA: HIT family protein [Frankiaceae bacterium]|jgi:diadenosine tetraphosphate (Ap4A) HIT family hydrolase|nr:HIT family protein [Frankiaceae bacterium]